MSFPVRQNGESLLLNQDITQAGGLLLRSKEGSQGRHVSDRIMSVVG